MKNSAVIICMMIATACNTSKNEKQDAGFISAPKDTVPKKDFSHVVFASLKDTSCGMPLQYGLEDTLHFNGKVYGFCSKGCKDAFADQLKKEKKL